MLPKSNPVKLLLSITLISIMTACFFSCKYFSQDKSEPVTVTIDKTRCAPCMDYNDVNPTESKLNIDLLKTMAFNYQNPIPVDETRSVWFSLETLKKFIHQIESESCECSGNLGVRIYYGRYPAITGSPFTDLGNLQNEYSGIHTIFMVPTIDKPDGYHYDFDPADALSRCKPYRYSPMDSTGVYPPGTTSVTALMAMNHGDACPPLPPNMNRCPETGAYFNR